MRAAAKDARAAKGRWQKMKAKRSPETGGQSVRRSPGVWLSDLFPIQRGVGECVALVAELQREKRRVLCQQAEEDSIALPAGQRRHGGFFDPLQRALVAVGQRTGEAVRREQVHVFRLPSVGHERDNAAVAPVCQRQAGLLTHLAQQALLRAFVRLKLAAHADPFVVVEVVFLLDAVQHQVAAVPLNVAERGVEHALAFFHRFCVQYTLILPDAQGGARKRLASFGASLVRCNLCNSHSAGDLAAAEAAGACIDVFRSSVHDGLDALHIGFPRAIGASVRVAHLNAKRHALVAKLTLCHGLKHLLVSLSARTAFLS